MVDYVGEHWIDDGDPAASEPPPGRSEAEAVLAKRAAARLAKVLPVIPIALPAEELRTGRKSQQAE